MSYTRHSVVSIEEVLPYINKQKKKEFNGKLVRVKSERLKCFKFHGIVCKHCGIIGKFFAIEMNSTIKENWHLNLYGINKYGHEVLMTADHIVPRGMGGGNDISNLQTLCTKCNHKKGCSLEQEIMESEDEKN